MLTISKIAQRCRVSIKTISDWWQKGLIRAIPLTIEPSFSLKIPDQTQPRSTFDESRVRQLGVIISPEHQLLYF